MTVINSYIMLYLARTLSVNSHCIVLQYRPFRGFLTLGYCVQLIVEVDDM
jgi:hypothetical protein